jgi:hypothetical protein
LIGDEMATDPDDPTTIEHQPVTDRVVEVSKYPNGSPAQNDGYEEVDLEEEAASNEPDVPQVSGVVAAQQDAGEETTTRRRRSKNTETAAER